VRLRGGVKLQGLYNPLIFRTKELALKFETLLRNTAVEALKVINMKN
jgi:hypothetical protein